MIIVLGVALLFAVWSGPSWRHEPSWPLAAQWAAWLLVVAALVLGIVTLHRGWP